MLVPLLRSAEEKTLAARWVLLSLPVLVATLFLVSLAAIQLVPAWAVAVLAWALVVLAGIFTAAICVRVTLDHRIAFLAVASNICAAALTVFPLVIAALLSPDNTGLAEGWPVMVWFASPYAGHCALALIFRRDRLASNPVLAGTTLSIMLAVFCCLVFVHSTLVDSSNGIEPVEDLRPVVLLGVPVLQWSLVLVSGLVALLSRSPRHDRKIGGDEV